MQNKVLQPSNPSTNNKQNLKKQKYRLIMSIQQLKKPVLNVVHSIITKKQQKENTNTIKNNKNHSKSYAEITNYTQIISQGKGQCPTDLHINGSSEEYKKMKQKCNFTQKVHHFFNTKKYNYIGEEDNIDRLNAKLDKYISRYLGHKHEKGGKLII